MRSTLVIGLFALVTFDQSLAQPQRVVQRTIVPYASGVEGNGFVSGSFVIRPARAGERSVGTLFPVSGGACHVADLNAIGIPAPSAAVCQQDSDCNSRLSRLHYSVAGWRSYCSAGTCLTRPGGQNERAILEVSDRAQIRTAMERLGMHEATLVQRAADESHLAELVDAIAAAIARTPAATLALAGRAQTIQALRRSLNARAIRPVATLAKAYWAPGKVGLD